MRVTGTFFITGTESNFAETIINKLFLGMVREHVAAPRNSRIFRRYKTSMKNKSDQVVPANGGFSRVVIVKGFSRLIEYSDKFGELEIATMGFSGYFQSKIYKNIPRNPCNVNIYLRDDKQNTSRSGEIRYDFTFMSRHAS